MTPETKLVRTSLAEMQADWERWRDDNESQPGVVYDPDVGVIPDEELNLVDIPEIQDFSRALPLDEFLVQRRARRIREINGKREWLNSCGVWQEFPTEEELREMPPVSKNAKPVWVGPVDGFLELHRKQREAHNRGDDETR